MRKLSKLFTIAVVVFTITWAVGLAAFVPTAQAVSLTSGDLIKASLPAVYYYGADGSRYVFPNEKTYKTWYSDFSSVVTITDDELAAIPIGGNVTYKPGVKMLKIQTDPKAYAVDQNGTLRWVKTEAVASCLYGSEWTSMIDDVSDAFFVNYTVGSPIEDCADYTATDAENASSSINVDKGLATDDGTTPGPGGALSIALASDSPASQSVPGGAATPASNVIFTKINLTAGSDAVVVDKIRITRTGLSADADLASIRLWSGAVQLDTAQTLNSSHQATFNVDKTIAANSTLVVTVSADLAATAGLASAEFKLGVASSTDVVSNASAVTGAPVWGNTMTAVNTNVGGLTIQQGGSMPALGTTVDLNQTETFFSVKFTAGSTEDVEIRSFTLKAGNNSSINVGDLEEIVVINDTTGDTMVTMSTTESNGDIVVDLSGDPLVLAKGATRDIILRAKVVDGAGRNVAFDVHDGVSFMVDAVGKLYGFGVALTDGGGWVTTTTGIGPAVAVNQGNVTISKADTSPAAGNIPVGGTEIPVAEFAYDLQGEDVRFGTTVVTLNVTSGVAGACQNIIDNVKLVDGSGDALAGPVTPSGTLVSGVAGTCTATFSSSYELPNGENTVAVVLNTTSSIQAGDTVQAQITSPGAFSNVRGLTSNRIITPAPAAIVTTNTQTVSGAFVAAEMGAVPIAGNVVAGKSGMWIAYVGLDASAGGEDVRVQNMTLANTGALPNTGWINAKLINVATGMQVGQTVQPSATNTVNFTFSGDELLVMQAEQVTLALEVDILSTAIGTAQFDVTVLAGTGKSSATVAGTNSIPTTVLSPLQTVIASGTLRVALDPDTATPAQLVSSSTGNSVVTYNLEAVDESINVEDVYIAVTNAAGTAVPAGIAANLLSIEVYADGVKLGSSLSSSSTGIHLLSLSTPITIGKDDKTVLTIKANMQSKANIASGTIFRVGVADAVAVNAQSVTNLAATDTMSVSIDSMFAPNYTLTFAGGGADGTGVVIAPSIATGATVTVETGVGATPDPTWAQVVAAINGDATAGPIITAAMTAGGGATVLAADFPLGPLAFANTWGVAGAYRVQATGVDSGAIIGNINTTGLVGGLIAGGNAMSAHDGVLTVTLNSSSPSGLKVAATNQEIMRLNLTATGDDITIGALDLNVSTTGTIVPGAATAIKSADGGTTYWTAAAIAAGGGAVPFLPAAIVNELSISKDTTKVIKIEGETSGLGNPDTLQASLQAGANTINGVAWFAGDSRVIGHTAAGVALITAQYPAAVDGDGTGLWTGPATKELPLTGGAVSY